MKRSHTPDIASHAPGTEHATPTKAKLQGAVEYAEYLADNNLIHTKQRAFDFFNVPRRSDQRILAQIGNKNSKQETAESTRRTNHTSKPEPRGAQ